MKNNIGNKKTQEKQRIISVLILSATFITLYFNPSFTDPFNAPKLFLLILTASWLFGYLVTSKNIENNKYKKLLLLVVIFEAILLIEATLTDVKYIAILGKDQRQLGLITYSGLAIYMLVTSKYFSFKSKRKLQQAIFFIGTVNIVYGLMQHTGNDFVKWNNQYNPIIGTLGNPNFAASFMAIVATLSFSFMFNRSSTTFVKLMYLLITAGLLVNIYFSDAKQGILSSGLGILVFLCIQIFKKNHKFGVASFSTLFIIAIFSILGMLQLGPLEKYLYKDSISLRGFYWRAGISMLQNNLLTGVGLDRYGENFKKYREVGYPLTRGFELTSTNAHNVPIQLFATGGLFLGISYLAVIFYIFFCGIKNIKSFENDELIFSSGIFSAWIAYIAQSIISIDNIGLTIWGWILGGAIVGLSLSKNTEPSTRNKELKNTSDAINQTNFIQPLVSGLLIVFALIFVFNLSKGELNTMQARTRFNPQIINNSNLIKEYSNLVINDPLAQPYYKLMASDYLIRSRYQTEGLGALQKLVLSDPVNPDFLAALASVYESMGKYEDSIKVRTNLIKYDPQNAKNYLQLARLYRDTGNIDKAIEMKTKILSFAPNSEPAGIVKKEIQP